MVSKGLPQILASFLDFVLDENNNSHSLTPDLAFSSEIAKTKWLEGTISTIPSTHLRHRCVSVWSVLHCCVLCCCIWCRCVLCFSIQQWTEFELTLHWFQCKRIIDICRTGLWQYRSRLRQQEPLIVLLIRTLVLPLDAAKPPSNLSSPLTPHNTSLAHNHFWSTTLQVRYNLKPLQLFVLMAG